MSSLLAPEERVLATLNADGSRRWLDPRPVEGPWRRARKVLAWALIVVFMGLPHLHADGRQLFFINIAGGEFTLFGVTFLRTDTLLLALGLIGLFVSIFLVTALFGRVWCGWACPQTVYLEFVYRPLGKLFDGKGKRGLRGVLSRLPAPVRGAARWGLATLISFHLANTFLAYFVGSRTVFEWSLQPPWVHPAGFLFVVFVTGLMLFNFGFFREQLCLVACPYGRFQSVLLDRQSLIVGYDAARGEPRGKPGRARAAGEDVALDVLPAAGDCVDCHLCVAVCPTGIDIRDGLQMECIHCTRCMDACDGVMAKVGKDPGLIRYSSQAVLSGEKPRFLRARVIAYPLILAVVFTSLVTLAAGHAAADVRLVRGKGQPFYTLPSGEISNQIRVRITNRTDGPRSYTITAMDPRVRLEGEAGAVGVERGETVSAPLLVIAEPSVLAGTSGVARVDLLISDDQGFETTQTCRILGPMNIPADAPVQEVTP